MSDEYPWPTDLFPRGATYRTSVTVSGVFLGWTYQIRQGPLRRTRHHWIARDRWQSTGDGYATDKEAVRSLRDHVDPHPHGMI